MTLAALAVLCLRLQKKTVMMFFALPLLLFQPIWLYLARMPTSEMLQLFLVISAGIMMTFRNQSWKAVWLLGIIFMAAVINRYTFLPFGALFILIMTGADLESVDRRRILRDDLTLTLLLLGGVAVDHVTAEITILRLRDIVPSMQCSAIIFILAALLVDSLACRENLRMFMLHFYNTAVRLGGLVFPAALALLWFHAPADLLAETTSNLQHLTPYLGKPVMLLALAGTIGAVCLCREPGSRLKTLLAFLLLATVVIMFNKHIKNLYPWATRRFLVYTVLLCVLAAAGMLANLWQWKRHPATGPALALILCLFALGWNTPQSLAAWRNTEYNGVRSAIAEIAERTDPEDIIVADHPWWGTPLTFIHGRQVLNGKRLWEAGDINHLRLGLRTLKAFHERGHRIRFLTSTGDGLQAYPFVPLKTRLDWTSEPLEYSTIIQHRSATGFEMAKKKKIFRLYTWEPPR
jgi:hypothetical protein